MLRGSMNLLGMPLTHQDAVYFDFISCLHRASGLARGERLGPAQVSP